MAIISATSQSEMSGMEKKSNLEFQVLTLCVLNVQYNFDRLVVSRNRDTQLQIQKQST